MFDTILGLPTHILVIHAVVVLGPIAALAAIAYAVRPGWRPALRWPLAGLAVATGLTGAVAGESGEQLEHRLRGAGLGADQMALVHDHAEAGDLAKVICLVFMAVVLVAVLWSLKPGAGGPLALATVVGLVLVALATIGSVSVTATRAQRRRGPTWSARRRAVPRAWERATTEP